MPSYVMLFRYTHQGLEHVKQSPDRVDAVKKVFADNGAKVKDFYFLLGEYDTIFVAEAPSDEVMAKLALLIAAQGNVRTETIAPSTSRSSARSSPGCSGCRPASAGEGGS